MAEFKSISFVFILCFYMLFFLVSFFSFTIICNAFFDRHLVSTIALPKQDESVQFPRKQDSRLQTYYFVTLRFIYSHWFHRIVIRSAPPTTHPFQHVHFILSRVSKLLKRKIYPLYQTLPALFSLKFCFVFFPQSMLECHKLQTVSFLRPMQKIGKQTRGQKKWPKQAQCNAFHCLKVLASLKSYLSWILSNATNC